MSYPFATPSIKSAISAATLSALLGFSVAGCVGQQAAETDDYSSSKQELRHSPLHEQKETVSTYSDSSAVSRPENEQLVISPAPEATADQRSRRDMQTRQAAKLTAGNAQVRLHTPMPSQGYHPMPPSHPVPPADRENYAQFEDNNVKLVADSPVSTFSIDVDTGSYANLRRMLNAGQMPRRDAVRVEEMLNYFDYAWEGPNDRDMPFSVTTELAQTPWNANTRLMLVGIQGYEVPKEEIPAANLVFLLDVSGSMHSANKLPLLQSSMKLLTKQLDKDDRVSIVVYAGASGVVLEPTPGNERRTINAAIERLRAGGSTNGAAGIQAAYALADEAWIEGGVNRIILATDGDFNVGTTNFEALKQMVEIKRKSGVTLTTLGFGTGNYNDHLMEQLADAGNGNYGYIDTLNEANKLLVQEMGSTLLTIAKDVKIQIEFNPEQISEYRLIGYENRLLNREDFNNDKIDAGDIGAGHNVTALYEVTLVGDEGHRIDPLRYGSDKSQQHRSMQRRDGGHSNELAFLRLRYKQPNGHVSRLQEFPIYRSQLKRQASEKLQFAAAVAGFGQLLRGGEYVQDFDYQDVATLARESRGKDPFGYRGEFLRLVSMAESLAPEHRETH